MVLVKIVALAYACLRLEKICLGLEDHGLSLGLNRDVLSSI